jgi:aldose 1-epimerase
MPEAIGAMPDGTTIHAIALRGHGLRARVLTLGAIVQDLRHESLGFPLVIGSADPLAYLGPMAHVGAMVGRFANRIGGAGFALDGRHYRLDANWRARHCLHGGAAGSGFRLWRIIDRTPESATLALHLPDGHMGFPGSLEAEVEIALRPGPELAFDIRARADQPTPCSFAHHGYFRLDDGPDLRHHRLRLDTDAWLEVDADQIPTGRVLPVTGSPLDFRRARGLSGVDLDHCFCLPAGTGPRAAAWLESTATGLSMRLETSAPGLQLYTAQHFPAEGLAGLDGRRHGPHAGLALEAQEWPDSPNHAHFPCAILRPGALWRQTTRYIFSTASKGPP